MSVEVLNSIKIYDSFIGMEKAIIEEYNLILNILLDVNVSFNFAARFLDSLSYFTILALNNKIYVRQITDKGSPSKETILKKKYYSVESNIAGNKKDELQKDKIKLEKEIKEIEEFVKSNKFKSLGKDKQDSKYFEIDSLKKYTKLISNIIKKL